MVVEKNKKRKFMFVVVMATWIRIKHQICMKKNNNKYFQRLETLL